MARAPKVITAEIDADIAELQGQEAPATASAVEAPVVAEAPAVEAPVAASKEVTTEVIPQVTEVAADVLPASTLAEMAAGRASIAGR